MVKGQGSINYTLWAEVKGIMSFIFPVRCLQEAGETTLIHTLLWLCLFNSLYLKVMKHFGVSVYALIHSTKKVSSRLTLFDITREIFNLICSFKNWGHAQFEWSIIAIYHYFHIQNMFYWAGAWKKVTLLFNGGATRRSILCQYFKVMRWSATGLLTKSATFFLAPDFINSVISQYNGEYGQRMTTQNVRK